MSYQNTTLRVLNIKNNMIRHEHMMQVAENIQRNIGLSLDVVDKLYDVK